MTLARLAIAALVALLSIPAGPIAVADASPLELPRLLDARLGPLEDYAGIVVSDPLARAPLYAHNAEELVVTASLYKLAVLLEAERRVQAGTLRYADEIVVEFEDVLEGSFELPGTILSLDEALERMIVLSDNGTAHALVRLLGADEINAALAANGIAPFRLGWWYGEDNVATPASVATFFEKLARRELVARDASERMLARLARQQINDRLPAQLPPGTLVAHKTGDLLALSHDAGVIYGPNGRAVVIVVMTWYLAPSDAAALMQDVAALVYASAFAAPVAVSFALPHEAVPADAGRGLLHGVRLANLGALAWSLRDADPFTLAWEMRDARGALIARNASPIAVGNVPAGESVDLPVLFTVPSSPGDYTVTVGLATARLGALAHFGAATGRFVLRAHAPYLVALGVELSPLLHREEPSVALVTLRPSQALVDERALRLGWRLLDPRTGRQLASGEGPLGVAKPNDVVDAFTYLVAPRLRGGYTLELVALTETGAAASEPVRRRVEITGPRTYGDELPNGARPATSAPRPDPIPRPTFTLPPLPAPQTR